MEEKTVVYDEKTQLKHSWNVASVWFGTHCGPGAAAGTTVCTYFIAGGGYRGMIWAFVSMIIAGLIFSTAVELSRLTGARSYNQLFRTLWGEKLGKLVWVADIATLYGTIVAFSSIFAGANSVFQMFFNTPMLVGGIFVGVAGIILCLYGDELVRKVSSILTIALIICIAVSCIFIFSTHGDAVAEIWNSKWQPEGMTVGKGFYNMILYIGVIMPYACNCVVTAEPLKRRKDVAWFGIFGTILNGLLVGLVALAMFCFLPDALSHNLPFLMGIQQSAPAWMSYIFFLIYVLALISTVVSVNYNLSARFAPLLRKKWTNLGNKGSVAIVAIIVTIIALIVSTFGLLKIVLVGYKMMGYINNIIWSLPLVIVAPVLVSKYRKKELAEIAAKNR